MSTHARFYARDSLVVESWIVLLILDATAKMFPKMMLNLLSP